MQVEIETGGVDLDGSLRILAMLPGDPTVDLRPGRLARATHTPDGPGAVTVSWQPGASTAHVEAHGPGADWLVDHAAALLGVADDPTGFEPREGSLRDLWRRHRTLRVPRTGTPWHDLCWLIVQQRIERAEAARQWRRFVQRYGAPAPGPGGLLLPPTPDRVARIPAHELHPLGIEQRRADTLRRAAASTLDLDALADLPSAGAIALLGTLPGVGPWTTSTLSVVTWGDPDTVIVGDSGIPSLVSWVVAREPVADDRRLVELLEPFRPHRYRVIQLAFASGWRPPRRRPHPRRVDIARR